MGRSGCSNKLAAIACLSAFSIPPVWAEAPTCSAAEPLKFGARRGTVSKTKFMLRGNAWVCVKGSLAKAPSIDIDGRTNVITVTADDVVRQPDEIR
jgi:hypothetical protein